LVLLEPYFVVLHDKMSCSLLLIDNDKCLFRRCLSRAN
jgi:hypothetical protein